MSARKVPEPAEEPEPAPPAPEPAAPERPAMVARAWDPVESRQRGVRVGLLVIAVIMLAVGCITAFYASMRIASIWFDRQYVPIAQLVVAGIVIAACVRTIRGLNRR